MTDAINDAIARISGDDLDLSVVMAGLGVVVGTLAACATHPDNCLADIHQLAKVVMGDLLAHLDEWQGVDSTKETVQ